METRERQLELAAADRKAEEAMLPDYENTPGAVRDTGVYSRVYRPYSSGGAYPRSLI